MNNWEWPQYVIAGWWSFGIVLGLIFMAVSHKDLQINYRKFALRVLDIIVLTAILYAGGFWS